MYEYIFRSGVYETLVAIIKEHEQKHSDEIANLVKKYLNKRNGGDCSGFVSFINKQHQNVYFKERQLDKFYTKRGSKSEAIFNFYKSKNLIIQKEPKVGDLIFFHNTTNKTKNNLKNKFITHIGIVDKVYKDGGIRFSHHNGKKIDYGFMNLNHKNTHIKNNKTLNSYIISCKKFNTSCLSSNRFAGFASVRF